MNTNRERKYKAKPPERILVRGVNWLGDAVMTMPALCRLREALPDAHIAILDPGEAGRTVARAPRRETPS